MMISTAGGVIAVALDNTAQAKRSSAATYGGPGRRVRLTAARYIRRLAKKNRHESTSRRSVTHETDSTRSGWIAHSSEAALAAIERCAVSADADGRADESNR